MDCKHDVNYLMGTSEGIVCRKCGKVFPSLSSLRADLEADRAAQEAPKAEPVKEETPKTRTRKKKEDK